MSSASHRMAGTADSLAPDLVHYLRIFKSINTPESLSQSLLPFELLEIYSGRTSLSKSEPSCRDRETRSGLKRGL